MQEEGKQSGTSIHTLFMMREDYRHAQKTKCTKHKWYAHILFFPFYDHEFVRIHHWAGQLTRCMRRPLCPPQVRPQRGQGVGRASQEAAPPAASASKALKPDRWEGTAGEGGGGELPLLPPPPLCRTRLLRVCWRGGASVGSSTRRNKKQAFQRETRPSGGIGYLSTC